MIFTQASKVKRLVKTRSTIDIARCFLLAGSSRGLSSARITVLIRIKVIEKFSKCWNDISYAHFILSKLSILSK